MCIHTSRGLWHCLRGTLPEHEMSVLRNSAERNQFHFMYFIHLNLVSFGITYSTQPAMEMATWYCVYHNLVSKDQGRKEKLYKCYKTAAILLNEVLCVLLEALVETRHSAAILWYAVVREHPQRRWTFTFLRQTSEGTYLHYIQTGFHLGNKFCSGDKAFLIRRHGESGSMAFKIYFLLNSFWCNQRSTNTTFLDL